MSGFERLDVCRFHDALARLKASGMANYRHGGTMKETIEVWNVITSLR